MKKINFRKFQNTDLADWAYSRILEAIPEPEYTSASGAFEAFEDGEISEEELQDTLLMLELENVSYFDVLDIVDGAGGYDFLTFDSKEDLDEYISSVAAEFIEPATDEALRQIREFHEEMFDAIKYEVRSVEVEVKKEDFRKGIEAGFTLLEPYSLRNTIITLCETEDIKRAEDYFSSFTTEITPNSGRYLIKEYHLIKREWSPFWRWEESGVLKSSPMPQKEENNEE